MDRRCGVVAAIVAGALTVVPLAGPARASDDPPVDGLHDKRLKLRACRNHATVNGLRLAAPELFVLAGRSSAERAAGTEDDEDDVCRRSSRRRTGAVAPRLIVSARGFELDLSVGQNWWDDLRGRDQWAAASLGRTVSR